MEQGKTYPVLKGSISVSSVFIIDTHLSRFFPLPEKEILSLIFACFALILICSLAWWFIYTIRLKRMNLELKKKEKIISETKEAYEATLYRFQKINSDLVAAKEKAEEADQLKTAFLTNISHEIRTPMNAIVGLASFLTEPGLSKEETSDYIEIINSNCKQLLTVIDDIVDISKIEAGQVQVITSTVNVNKLLKELFIIYEKQAGMKGISLSYSCEKPDDLIQIRTDESRVKQVFYNLLNNALKFTEKGMIVFGYTLKEKHIEFYVRDNGIGISPEYKTLIFNRFWQAGRSNSRMYGGMGLGLSISKGLVEKLGGTMWVDSEPGSGSVFYFTIPYLPDSDSTEYVLEKINNESCINWGNKSVMVVEDNPDNYTFVEKILKNTGVRIIHAWNGLEATELLKIYPEISLVLMDFKMPVMDGYEATRLIKELRPEIPVIAQTAYAFNDDRIKIIEAGCVDFFSKPFQKDLLLKVMRKYLEAKKL